MGHCQETQGIMQRILLQRQYKQPILSQLKIACFTYFTIVYHGIVLVVVVVIAQLLWQFQICSEHRRFRLCIHVKVSSST